MKAFGELEQLIGSAIFSRISSRTSAASFVLALYPWMVAISPVV
jgi:hypothetical protein